MRPRRIFHHKLLPASRVIPVGLIFWNIFSNYTFQLLSSEYHMLIVICRKPLRFATLKTNEIQRSNRQVFILYCCFKLWRQRFNLGWLRNVLCLVDGNLITDRDITHDKTGNGEFRFIFNLKYIGFIFVNVITLYRLFLQHGPRSY